MTLFYPEDASVLNKVYERVLEFGPDWRCSVTEITGEIYPAWLPEKRRQISAYLEAVRAEIEDFCWRRYDGQQPENNRTLAQDCRQMIREKFGWMEEKNVVRSVTQAMYYAWHG